MKTRINTFCFAVIFCLLFAIQAQSEIINVPDDHETIQEAINAAEDGDSIIVAPGEYVENIDFSGKNISLIGNPDNPEEVVIDGGGEERVVLFECGENENCLLIGFTIQNGWSNNERDGGGGIRCYQSSPTLRNLIITDNVASPGAGVRLRESNSILKDLLICNNEAPRGPGGIEMFNANATLENVTIVHNTGGEEVACGIFLYLSEVIIKNSIIWDNGPYQLWFHEPEGRTAITLSYTNVEDGQNGIANAGGDHILNWGEGNIDADPLFVDPDNGDFHLTEDSPCIDTGDPESPEDPDRTRVDMGALYFHQELPEIMVSFEMLNFGNVPTHETTEQTLTITNTGNADLTISDISIAGRYFDCDFDEEIILAPDESHELTVTFTPEEFGVQEGILTIRCNDPDENGVEVALTGTGMGQIREIGYCDTPGSACGMAISGGFAYVADYDAGLCVIDISNPAEPRVVGNYDTPDCAFEVAVSGGYAYVADFTAGLRVIDVSDPTQPREVGYHDTPDHAFSLAFSGGFAYVADDFAGLRIIDVSNPTEPREVGVYDTPGRTRGVAVSGGFAYVGDNESGFRVADVSNPAQPREVGYCDTPGHAEDVVVSGEFAYVADYTSGLRVIDVSNPAEPREVGYYDTPGAAHGVTVFGGFAYVCDDQSGLWIIDVSNPAQPREVGYFDTPGGAITVGISGGFAYVADMSSGLRILDVSDFFPKVIFAQPGRVEFEEVNRREETTAQLTVSNLGYENLTVFDVQAADEHFSVDFGGEFVLEPDESRELTITFAAEAFGDFEGVLTIFSDDPENAEAVIRLSGKVRGEIREVGNYDNQGTAYWVAVVDDLAFVANGGLGLRIIDVSNPDQPREVGFYDTPGLALGIAVSGAYAYVADDGGLRVIDVTNPAQPRLVGSCETPGRAWSVAVSGDFAYVADYLSGLRIIDVSNPAQPQEIGFYDTPGNSTGVAVSGELAYVADAGSGLCVIDVSDPEQPQEIGQCDTPDISNSVFVSGDFAYVAGNRLGLRIIDVSEPAHPFEAGYYDTPGCAQGVSVYAGFAYIADYDAGLLVLDISDPAEPFEVGWCDTPDRAISVAIAGGFAYEIEWHSGILNIFDVSNFIPGVVKLEPDLAAFGRINFGEQAEAQFTVSNVGFDVLTVSDIQVEGDFFYLDREGGFDLEPDESAEITVTFAPEAAGDFEGALTIFSDDYSRPELSIPLTGTGIPTLPIQLSQNWNQISINVSPPQEFYEENDNRGPDVIRMMEQLRIDEDSHHVLLMKNEDGRFYLPAFGFNNIPYWDLTRGYQVKVDSDVEAVWSGEPIPADADIWLDEGWNIIAYFPTYQLDARRPDFYVLSPIIDHVVMAKNNEGSFLVPRFNFSNMPPWRETQGYQVKVSEDVLLNYPSEQEELNFIARTNRTIDINQTSCNMSLLLNGCESGQVTAITSDGTIVGTGTVDLDGRCGLAVWGDDESTDEKDGLAEGESFRLKYLDKEIELEVKAIHTGNGLVYETNSFTVIDVAPKAEIPEEYYLSQNYPNPFNSTTRIRYGLPEAGHVSLTVYDISGRVVQTLIDMQVTAGHHTVEWDAGKVSSGLYLIQLEASNFKAINKVVLAK